MKKMIVPLLLCGILLGGCTEEDLAKKDPGAPPEHPEQLIQEPMENLEFFAKHDKVKFPTKTPFGKPNPAMSRYYGDTLTPKDPLFGEMVNEEVKTVIYSLSYKGEKDEVLELHAAPVKLTDKVDGYKKEDVKSKMTVYSQTKENETRFVIFDETVTYVMIGKNLPEEATDLMKETVESMKEVKDDES